MSRPEDARSWLIIAVVATVVCSLIPFANLLLYPFALFETFVHETMHAFAAVVTGGSVEGMNVNWDTSGLTRTRGGWSIAISTAGYLGSLALGAALLVAGRRTERAPVTLMVVGGLTLVATFLFAGYGSSTIPLLGFGLGASLVAYGRVRLSDGKDGDKHVAFGGFAILGTIAYLVVTGGALTWAVGLLIGLGTIAAGVWLPKWLAQGALIFLAIQNVLGSLEGLKVLFDISVGTGGHSDAVNMAAETGIPAVFWAAMWGVTGLAVAAGAFWVFWRDARE